MNQRIFICGSEWLYMKIYSGPRTIENILVNKVFPLLMSLLKNGIIDSFFFIRYTDPNYHIRLRLHFDNTNNIGIVLNKFNQILDSYVCDFIISRVIIDVYNREIERYRDKYIIDVERLFFYDSKFILNYILTNSENEDEKWLIPIKYIDLFLDKCGFSLMEKMNFCQRIYETMLVETGLKNKANNKQLKLKYRNRSNIIKEVIMNKNNETQYVWIKDITNYFDDIDVFIQKINREDSSEKFDILSSIIHMHINRLFRTRQRINECVIYYLLFKFYNSTYELSKMSINPIRCKKC